MGKIIVGLKTVKDFLFGRHTMTIFTRIMIYVTLFLLLSLGTVSFLFYNERKNTGLLEERLNVVDGLVLRQGKVIRDMDAQRRVNEELVRKLEGDLKLANGRLQLTRGKIRELEKKNEEVKDYLDERMPDALFNELRDHLHRVRHSKTVPSPGPD